MKSFVLISAICLQLGWSNAKGLSNGVGAFSYQDSSGTRYGGTYGLKDGEVVDAKGTFPPDFSPPTDFQPPTFDEPDNFLGFFPEYFRNLENLLQDPEYTYYGPTQQTQYIPTPSTNPYSHWPAYIPDYGQSDNRIPNYSSFELPNYMSNHEYYTNNINRAFQANLDNQKLALDAAHKAFDLTSNQPGISPSLNPSRSAFSDPSRFGGFPTMPGFPNAFPFTGRMNMPNFGNSGSSSFASASAGPGYNHHVAAISPGNPNSPNIIKTSQGSGAPGGYRSVSVSSYSSSSDINGQKTNRQGANTYIDDNGKISGYSVHSP